MRRLRIVALLFALILAASDAPRRAGARGGTFTTIDDPHAVGGSGAYSIDATRGTLGWYGSSSLDHGFLLHRGAYVTIDDPNAGMSGFKSGTYPSGFGPHGEIDGYYTDSGNVYHGFLLHTGGYARLDDPHAGTAPGQGTYATGMNLKGVIVGGYFDGNGVSHAFFLRKGVYRTIDDPKAGSRSGQGTGGWWGMRGPCINSKGDVVGNFADSGSVNHGFLLHNGHFTTIDDPKAGPRPGQGTQAICNNLRGDVVGSYLDGRNARHGFLLRDGIYTTIDDPDGSTVAHGIDSKGEIVGSYTAGGEHAFLYRP
jgi:hypothetical protein